MSVTYNAKVNLNKNSQSNLKGFATLFVKVAEDCSIAINGFRIINGQHGLFVAPPQTKGQKPDPETGKDIYYNDVRFLETKAEGEYKGPIETQAVNAVLEAYGALVGGETRSSTAAANTGKPTPSNDRPTSPVTQVSNW